jgi:adenine-specific DNA-methyltransferase
MLSRNDSNSMKEPISFVETPEEIADLMIKLITNRKSDLVLDTGCGRGIFLRKLLENEFTNITGIEFNKDLFHYCKANFRNIALFNADFLIWNAPHRYDLIIGNPPYAHYNSLPAKIQEEVYQITKTRESDIYYAFIMKSIDLLKNGGELIYIVPYGFFYNTHAKAVRRQILANGYLDTIFDLDETRIFQDEHPETIVFKFVKRREKIPETIKIARVKSKNAKPPEIYERGIEALAGQRENILFSYFDKQRFKNSKEIWSTFPQVMIPESTALKNLAFIGVGLVSGFDLAFRLNDEAAKSFNKTHAEILINCIKAENCKGFWTKGSVQYILIDDEIQSEDQLADSYPKVYERLLQYKNRMSKRYLPQKKKWFHWQALRNRTNIEKYMSFSKIFVPTLDRSKVNRFSLTDKNLYPAGDVLCIIPLKIDPHFLLGYLNSDFFREYYLSHGARRGHRIAFTQRILSNIKIPSFQPNIVNKIAQISQEITRTKDVGKRKLIDQQIEKAFENNLFEKTGLFKYI